MKMTRFAVLAAAGAFTVAGCSNYNSPTATTTAGDTPTVAVRSISGVGSTLVSSDAKTLYFADQETGGTIRCVDACLRFWTPLTVSPGTKPTATSALGGTLSTINRPDGATQVTYQGHPLYIFTSDSGPGHADGNGFTDTFGGTTFNWHASTTTGAAPTTTPSTNGYGY